MKHGIHHPQQGSGQNFVSSGDIYDSLFCKITTKSIVIPNTSDK